MQIINEILSCTKHQKKFKWRNNFSSRIQMNKMNWLKNFALSYKNHGILTQGKRSLFLSVKFILYI